jgi:hypothetical protein
MRNPGAIGAKSTFTVQMPGPVKPVQPLPAPNVKSRLLAPCVTTLVEATVALVGTLIITAKVLAMHPAATPPAQVLMLPKDTTEKVALTFCDWLVVTMHCALVPEQAPPQAVNTDPADGVAVSVTVAPLVSFSEHCPVTFSLLIAQLIAGEAEEFDVTVPMPEPVSDTVSV